ncbi:MAG: hypothetical protein OEY67_01045 [Gammaproteobacteria bacterium]|nr:hypothetical protein [Gammaproteobacteria bacterium]
MIGKKNIVFGFIYLVFTAALGPLMIVKYFGDVADAEVVKQQKVGELQQVVQDGYEKDMEPMTPDQIARMNTQAILSLSAKLNTRSAIDTIKGGPHAHGNLEALLNIAVGLLLCFLAINRAFKQLISWVFILGTVFHSGLLYLTSGLNLEWANTLLASPFSYIGPVMILLGLGLAGIASMLGFRGTIEPDY